MFASFVFAAVAFASPCASNGASLSLYLEADAVAARDSVAHVRLCLSGPRVNSMSARISVDTSFGRVAGVDKQSAASVFAHADTSNGTVLVAGAASTGIAEGALATMRVRLLRRGTLPHVSVVLTEMNDASGTSLVTRAHVVGLEARCTGAEPAVFEVLPPAVGAGEAIDLRISGCGFSGDRNAVSFGGVVLPGVRSSDDGTRIRVVIPKRQSLGAGAYDVTVNNGQGTSNAKRVTLR
jgi:hypothetical protein